MRDRAIVLLVLALSISACAAVDDVAVEAEDDDAVSLRHGEFIEPPDLGSDGKVQCNLYTQDCPPGEKCMPWANDGGGAWNALRCTELAPQPDQTGEPCTVDGSGVSGVDSCDRGLMCWDVDPETNQGRCIGMIRGSEVNPLCEDPLLVPQIASGGALAICLPTCSPLMQDCPGGQGCYPVDDDFTCAPVASGFPTGWPCEFINVCEPGNACIGSRLLPECDAAGCCALFCDTSAPECPGEQVCSPWESADPEHPFTANVGICVGP